VASALEAYHQKRDFGVTSEPRGSKVRRKGNSFVVQKHDASRLHYDFRLELDGVLKSWAAARGPSLVPGEKRLAVHVEDHPLDYGSFEGTIPEGQYGAGTVLVWDRGTWEPEGDPQVGYAKGHLDFTLNGQKLKGKWHLVRMRPRHDEKADNWLLIKANDSEARTAEDPDILEEAPNSVLTGRSLQEIASDVHSRRWTSGKPAHAQTATANSPRQRALAPLTQPKAAARQATKSGASRRADAKSSKAKRPATFTFKAPKAAKRAALPKFVAPMLPTLVDAPPSGAGWVHEIKFDGYRIEAVLDSGKVILRTRKGLDWTDRFPSVARAVAELPAKKCLIDGEVLVEDENGISDFSALQNALKEGKTQGLIYHVFDILHLDGFDLTKVPLIERKDLLGSLLKAGDADRTLRFSEHFGENGDLMLQHICRLGAEGIVSKRRDSPYRPGRTTDWTKSKCANRQEFVVVGYVPSTTARRAIGSLVLGYYDKGKLVHAGRVGTGFSNKVAADLFAELERERIPKPPVATPLPAEARRNVVWIKPTRVAEVEFRGWTTDGNLRQASFKGLREDKDPKEIVREKAVAVPLDAPASSVKLTHPDRVLWPDVGITKQGLADYYAMVWPWIEKHIVGRPLVLVRCPTGFVQGCFFQKHAWAGTDEHILQIHDPHEKLPILGIDSFDGLIALVQSAALEIHPWGSRSNDLDHPDRLIFDLDPGEGISFPDLIAGAREVRQRLAKAKLESFVKTTGGKGLHVVAPIEARATWDAAKNFCRAVAEAMERDTPQRFTATVAKKARSGHIYVDYLRNARGATAVAAYSTRARASAGISTPLAWDELEATSSASQFTLGNFGKRLQHLAGDPWTGFFEIRQALPAAP
jgi:bifunctional non-homologous end joining protein LigD